MKLKITLFAILCILPAHICLSSDNIFKNNDGYTWNAFNISLKTVYTMAFITGFNHAVYLSEELSNDISTVLGKTIPQNRSLAQIIDGIDAFYSDFKNKHIKINLAFTYVLYALQEGVTESELDKMMIEMRKDSN